MKEEILKLRAEGKTYKEITKIVDCAKSTVNYYCGVDQSTKTRTRTKKFRATPKGIALRKVDNFLLKKIGSFKTNRITRKVNVSFSNQQAYEKIAAMSTCYLTGRKLDLNDSTGFELDHIIPVSRGGENSLNNMGLTCKEANRAKHSLLNEEFITLCKEVLQHNGYEVTLKSGEIERNRSMADTTYSPYVEDKENT